MGDVMVMPLKMLGKSLNSVEKADLDAAREILLELAPHVLALDSDTYQDKLASEEAVLCLGWTGPLVELRAAPETADTKYIVPSEGSLYWLDTWVMMSDAPNPNAAYAWLNFIHDPENQANETMFTGYGSPNDEAKQVHPAGDARRPGDLPARGRHGEPRGRRGHVGQRAAHRHLAGVQVRHRRLTS